MAGRLAGFEIRTVDLFLRAPPGVLVLILGIAVMQTAEIALLVSGFSFLISAASLGWNIWSKFIFPKPRVRVTASVQQVFKENGGPSDPFVSLIAINYGPGDIIIHLPIAIGPRDWRRRREQMLLRPLTMDPTGTFNPKAPDLDFPRKLGVGESTSVHFPLLPFATKTMPKVDRFGFVDTFNRTHWVTKVETKKVRSMCHAAIETISHTGGPSPVL